jgi:glycosyltransferase involved in cell wall biosynthesis
MLTEGFYPPVIGGQQKLVHDLAARLVARGVSVIVITRQSEPPGPAMGQADGISVIRLPPAGQYTGKGWSALLPLTLFLLRVFGRLLSHRHDYDILLVSGIKTLPVPAIVAARLLGKRCCVRPESPIELWQGLSAKSLQRMGLRESSVALSLLHRMRYALLRRANRLVAISSQMETTLKDKGIPAHQIATIPNGIDTTLYHPATPQEKMHLRQALGLPLDRPLFVFTGRLTTSKGVPELIEAWRRVAEQYANAHLLLMGTGAGCFDDCEAETRQFVATHQLASCVTFTGGVTNVADYLRAADAFVFPSHYEGFGLSIIEAMACGLPIIVSRVGVALEAIQSMRNGMLVEANPSADDLAQAMCWLLEHPELGQQLGKTASHTVLAQYSIDKVIDLYLNMFLDVQSETTPRRLPHPRHAESNGISKG